MSDLSPVLLALETSSLFLYDIVYLSLCICMYTSI